MIAQGLSNATDSGRLVVAEQTVQAHVGRVPVKLGPRDRTQAAVCAYASGAVRPPGC
ncbi:helix-turn-helix transcriptional regulator [Streptomyces alfalfae]|uniref:Helix-turn-helix transcriptional regulator n=1 Tax=Streptomyces alfalfae TaxID=1642299 RepID=A0A7T4U227_9ACTN|nr:helix-turn-helix transcriptional regulator [Streptomyces alfalfae]